MKNISFVNKYFLGIIDAHRGEEGGRRRGKKLDHKNAIKHKNRGPTPRFFHNPKYPPQKNVKITVHLCS